MKPIPPALLDIFGYSDENDLKQEGYVGAVMDYTRHPYIIFGSVIKGVENFYIVCEMYNRQYGDKFEAIEQTLKQKYFDRLYGFLERFDESNCDHVLEALKFTQQEIAYALFNMREHFEKNEQYEECVKIQSIIETLFVQELPI